MERTNVGNDDVAHLFGDAPKIFEIRGKLLAFTKTERLGILQKSISLKSVQFKKLSDLSVRNLAFSEGLNDQGLQSLPRKFSRLCANRLQERIRNRDLECCRHTLKQSYHRAVQFAIRKRPVLFVTFDTFCNALLFLCVVASPRLCV